MADLAQKSNSIFPYFRNLRKQHSFKKYFLISGLLLFLVITAGLFISEKTSYHQMAFGLNEPDSTYQVAKCWTTDPPSYWLKQLKVDQNQKIHISNCSFTAANVIRLKETSLILDKILDRNVKPEGSLIREGNRLYYSLISAQLDSSTEPTPTSEPEKKIVIKRKTQNGEEVVYSEPRFSSHKIVKWRNYLFFDQNFQIDSNDSAERPKLLSYDLASGKKSIVYADTNNRTELNELKIINDTLYFSISGYLAESNLFWLSNPTAKPREILDQGKSPGDKIDYEDDKYWIKGGFGDGCGGSVSYSTFDPKTKAIKYILTTGEGCVAGDSFLGLDKFKTHAIISNHDQKSDSKYPSEQVYQSIARISLAHPTQKTVLIAPQDMPENIMVVSYASESGQLALAGENLQMFDTKSSQLNKIVDFPSNWLGHSIFNWTQEKLCISGNAPNSDNNQTTYEISLAEGSIKSNQNYCNDTLISKSLEKSSFEQIENQKINDLILELALPPEYSITY